MSAPFPPPPARVMMDDVLAAVAEASGIGIGAMMAGGRRRPVAHACQLAMMLGRDLTSLSHARIATRLRRDASTVAFGARAARQRINSDPGYWLMAWEARASAIDMADARAAAMAAEMARG